MSDWQQHLRRANAANLWLLAGLALAFAPHLAHLPLLITLPSAVLLGWRLLYELKYLPLPPRLARWLLTLAAISATFAAFHTLFGRQAGVGLLMVMLCLKLLEMNSARDVAVVIGLGYFVIITVFLFDQSIFMGVYMVLSVTLLTTALTAFSRHRSRLAQWANLRLAASMLLQAAPMMLILFVLFPRIPGPLWNLPKDSYGSATGLSDSMSPGKISQLSDNDSVAFRVQFQTPLPPAEQRYWRGPVFTQFDGQTWNNPDTNGRHRLLTAGLRYRAKGEPLRYSVTLEPHQQNWLFALDLPAELPAGSELTPDYEIVSRQPIVQLKRYAMLSYPDYVLGADNRPSSIYLQLPFAAAPRARQLAQQWRAQSRDQPDSEQYIVASALRYFHDQPFYYTRQPPLLTDDPVEQFLFDSRRGFCEHYASAFVFLMRAAGIPARVVTGYQGGEMNPLSDYFIVRQSDAHAWAEVWLPQRGWQRIDPTAVIPAARIENRNDLERILPELAGRAGAPGWTIRVWKQIGYSWDRINHAWNQWVVNYNDRRQRNLLTRFFDRLGLDDMGWREMVGLLVFALGGVTLFLAWRLLGSRRHQPPPDPASSAYRRFCRKLARHGISRAPAEGALDFCRRARQQRPDLGPAITHITALYQRSRYAPHPSAENLKRLQAAVRRFRA